MYYIYIFKNKTNNKAYIGKTNNIERRQIEHLSKSKTSNNGHFYNAIRKYGFDNFELNILYECENEEQAYLKETDYIKLYKSNDKTFGYNATSGGEGLKGISEDTRKKMSENGKLRIGDKNSFFCKKHSDETLKLFSKIRKDKISKDGHPMEGKHHSETSKSKISKANKNKRRSVSTEFKPGQPPTTAKLTMEQANQIRLKYIAGSTQTNLANEYGVDRSSIWAIVHNKSFKA
jgi:group I intron endonuclease